MNCNPHKTYTPHKQLIVNRNPIFKLHAYDDHTVMFCATSSAAVVCMDSQLTAIKRIHKFDQHVLAMHVARTQSGQFLCAGGSSGDLIIRPLDKIADDLVLKSSCPEQQFINDIICLPNMPTSIINCYNNGTIAIWDIANKQQVSHLANVHAQYTYKLRMHTPSILISCGSDQFVIRTDLQKARHIQSLPHPGAVWCADRVDDNCIASVGLFRKVCLWDARSKRIVQQCRLLGSNSSFLTTCNEDPVHVYLGDQTTAKVWDRRTNQLLPVCEQNALTSIEAMLFQGDDLIFCGRGSDIYLCRGSQGEQELTARGRPWIMDVQKQLLLELPEYLNSIIVNDDDEDEEWLWEEDADEGDEDEGNDESEEQLINEQEFINQQQEGLNQEQALYQDMMEEQGYEQRQSNQESQQHEDQQNMGNDNNKDRM